MSQQVLKNNYNILTCNIIVNNEDLYNIKYSCKLDVGLNVRNDMVSKYKIFESFLYYTSYKDEFIKIGYILNNERRDLCIETKGIDKKILEKIYYQTWKNMLENTHIELYHVIWKKKIKEINEDFMMNYWSIENSSLWSYQMETNLFKKEIV